MCGFFFQFLFLSSSLRLVLVVLMCCCCIVCRCRQTDKQMWCLYSLSLITSGAKESQVELSLLAFVVCFVVFMGLSFVARPCIMAVVEGLISKQTEFIWCLQGS